MRQTIIQAVPPHIDLVDELGKATLGRAFHLVGLQHHRCQHEQATPVCPRIGLQLRQRRVAYAAFRLVHHTLEGKIIMRGADKAEIARAADDAIRNAQQDEPFLKSPHLPGRTHKDGAILMLTAPTDPAFDIVCNQTALRFAIPQAAHLHLGGVNILDRIVVADIERLSEAAAIV